MYIHTQASLCHFSLKLEKIFNNKDDETIPHFVNKEMQITGAFNLCINYVSVKGNSSKELQLK